MIKKMAAILCLFITSAFITSNANASSLIRQYVDDILVSPVGYVFITFTPGPRADIPACGINYPNRYVIDASTPAGQARLSSILTAFAAGLPVTIQGEGTCNLYPDTETVRYIRVHRQ